MKKVLQIGLLSIFLTFGLVGQAAAECKGKSKSSCSSDAKCTWVNSYKTKSGSTVKAYCRNAAGKAKKKTTSSKSTSSKSKETKSTTKKSESKKSTSKESSSSSSKSKDKKVKKEKKKTTKDKKKKSS